MAGASKRLEPFLDNLTSWQAKKIYYFSDARDDKQFVGKGPSYYVREISASQKKPYWRLALDAAAPHRTQFAKETEQIFKMSDEQIEKMVTDPKTGTPEPLGFLLAKNQPGSSFFFARFPFTDCSVRSTRNSSSPSPLGSRVMLSSYTVTRGFPTAARLMGEIGRLTRAMPETERPAFTALQ